MHSLRSFLQVILVVGVIEVASGKSVSNRNGLQCACVSVLQCGADWRVGVEDDDSEENPCPKPGEVCCSKPSDSDETEQGQVGSQEAEPWDESSHANTDTDDQDTAGTWTGDSGDTWNNNPGREQEKEDQYHPRCTCVSSLKCGATLKTQVEEDEEEENLCQIPGEVCCPNSIVGEPEPEGQIPDDHQPQHEHEEQVPTEEHHSTPALGCGEFHSFSNPDTYLDQNSFPANFGELPWTVLLYNDVNPDTLGGAFCGGSLIREHVVLTAAHCLVDNDQSSIILRAGDWNLLDNSNAPLPFQDRKIRSFKNHPSYRKGYTPYDISIIIVEEPFHFDLNINPICLPVDYHDFNNENCLASGWGILPGGETTKPNILKKLQMSLVSRKQCRDMLRKTMLGSHFYLDKGFTCALGENGADTCQGDGGGPLACPSKDQAGVMILAGVTSWGVGCGEGNPSVFTDVVAFISWINEVLREYGLEH